MGFPDGLKTPHHQLAAGIIAAADNFFFKKTSQLYLTRTNNATFVGTEGIDSANSRQGLPFKRAAMFFFYGILSIRTLRAA